MSNEQKKSWAVTGAFILSLILAVASVSSWAVARSIGDKEAAIETRVDKLEAAVLQIPAISTKVDLSIAYEERNEKVLADIRQMFVAHIEKGNK